ncbi:MAG: LLM class flavin-dependent oxidoreductase [Thermoleophilia bacterium]
MSDGPPVGTLIMSTTPPGEIPGLARLAEQSGFSQLWVAEDYFFLGGFSAAAMSLAVTERIPVGIGIVSALVRHPAVTAMEIATIAGAFPGRFLPGIGLGVPGWVDQMGLTPKSVIATIRECVDSVRALLNGEELTVEGKQYTFKAVKLTHPPAVVPPIFTGAMQPRSLELSGEVADGNVIGAMAPLEYVPWSLERMKVGAERAGRADASLRAPMLGMFHCSVDGSTAKQEIRGVLAFYLSVWPRNVFTEMAGIADELEAMVAEGGAAKVAAEMPDAWVDTFTISGTPDECAERIEQYVAAGAETVVLAPYDGARGRELMELAAKEVLPRL